MTSKVILTNVQVLAAGTKIERDTDKNKPMPVSVVTLLVDPDEAERLTLASTEGKIQLALRNPLDKTTPATPRRQAGGAARPCRRPRPPAREPRRVGDRPPNRRRASAPSTPTVEIIRGDKRAHEVVRQEQSAMRDHRGVLVSRVAMRLRRHAPRAAPAGARADGRDGRRRRRRQTVRCSSGRSTRRRRRHADRARVADQRRHRRRAGHVVEPAARPRQAPGTISMFVWDRAGAHQPLRGRRAARPRAAQRADASSCSRARRSRSQSNGKNIVLSGTVVEQGRGRKAVERRRRLRRQEGRRRQPAAAARGAPSNQVLLRVRFAEVSRSAMTELRRVALHQPDRHQEHARPRRRRSSSPRRLRRADVTKASSDFGSDVTSATASSRSATS